MESIQTNIKSSDDRITLRHYNGSWTMCSGLCNEIVNVINCDREEQEEDDDQMETSQDD